MAEEDLDLGGGGEEAPEGGKKSSKMLIIIILVAVILLGGGGFFAWKFLLAEEEAPPPAQQAAQAGKAGEGGQQAGGEGGQAPTEKPGTVLNLEPFIVNLADPSGKRYLKLSLALDAKNEQLKKELEERMPQVRDGILLLLTSKTYQDIATTAGKIRLRNQVLQVINRNLGGMGSVHAVYFTEFVVQ